MKKYFILLFILLASCSKEAIEFTPETTLPNNLYTFNSATYGFILTIKESGKQYYIGKDKRIVKQEDIYSDGSYRYDDEYFKSQIPEGFELAVLDQEEVDLLVEVFMMIPVHYGYGLKKNFESIADEDFIIDRSSPAVPFDINSFAQLPIILFSAVKESHVFYLSNMGNVSNYPSFFNFIAESL